MKPTLVVLAADMRKKLLPLLLPLMAGCLTSRPIETSEWNVEYLPTAATAAPSPDRPVLRSSQVTVRIPYDCRELFVLRADGSVATDPYNRFAATPSNLLRGPAIDALVACGRFRAVVASNSSVAADVIGELFVTRFTLDCTVEGERKAKVALGFRVIDQTRSIIRQTAGEGEADAADGKYGEAFSRAFSQAIDKALSKL